MRLPVRRTWSLSLGVAALVVVVAATSAGAATLITGANIKNGTVEGVDLKNGTVALLDIAPGARSALRGNTGPVGPQGPIGGQGPIGQTGQTGAPGVSGYVVVTSGVTTVFTGTTGNARAICPDGKKVLSGGGFVAGGSTLGTAITTSIPDAVVDGQPVLVTGTNANAWFVVGSNQTGSDRTVQAYAVCATVS